MFDAVVVNGSVVDGTGAPARAAGIGIRGGRIAEIGCLSEDGGVTIDAAGMVVAPGFIDLHSHYDAQVFWDPTLSPSCLHGVTTVVAGNCGLTLAPCEEKDQDFLTRLLARVEAIPIEALLAGVHYTWRSYPEFLDVVAARPLGPNMGFMVGHSALRRAVLGQAASERAATEDELGAMCGLLDVALSAGGMGFSTANVATQVDGDGRPTPPNFATHEEFVTLSAVCAAHPGTSLEFIPGSFLAGFSDEEMNLMAEMSAAANRPLNWNTPLINKNAPDLFRRQLSASDLAEQKGGRVVALYMAQNGPTQQDFLRGYVYRALPGWGWLFDLDVTQRIRALEDPENRQRLRKALEEETTGLAVQMRQSWGHYLVNDVKDPTLKHLEGRRIGELAAENGTTDFDAVLDVAVAAKLEVGFVRYAYGDADEWTNEARKEVLKDPRVVLGASDAGAHTDMMVGADFPTRCLGELVREKHIFTLEEMIHQLTDVPARLYGLIGRGRLEEGACADMVIFDPDTVDAGPLRTVADMPAGASRLLTEPVGVRHVLVAGEALVSDGRATDRRTGQLLRSGVDTEGVYARPPAG
jgi:N-acyl-D-aspartate/D-glutamate deacylase